MSRFTDDYPFTAETALVPPAAANILLNRLGVSFALLDEQRAAVARWRQNNKPAPRLAADLRSRQLANVATA